MAPQSSHRRTVARCAALLGVLAVVSAVALHDTIPHEYPDVAHAAGALAQSFRTVNLDPAEGVQLHCRNGVLGPLVTLPATTTQTRGQVVCSAPLPPATVSPPAVATATRVPVTLLPTTTVVPTMTGVPTPLPPTMAPALIEGVPVCPHDATRWHGTVEPPGATGSAIRCAYGHTHMDDPSVLDSVLPPWPFAQTISYPHETFSENAEKHSAYKYAVMNNPQCLSNGPNANVANADDGRLTLQYVRFQYHGDGHKGAMTRFHSFYVQAQLCDPQNPSYHPYVQLGGHMDTGPLILEGFGHLAVPADTQPPVLTGESFAGCCARKLHGIPTIPRYDYTWYFSYGSTALVGFGGGLRNEDFGPVDPQAPNSPILFYGPDNNQSYQERFHIASFYAAQPESSGFTDVLGRGRPDCTSANSLCVPYLTRGWTRPGPTEYRADVQGAPGGDTIGEYDVRSPVTGNSLLKYPN